MMNEQLLRYEREADLISSKELTPTSRARLQFLLSAMKTTRELSSVMESRTTSTARDPLAFRKQFLKAMEARTYVPMNETDQSAIIPSNIEVKLLIRMLDFGPFVAGSPIMVNLPSSKMQSTRIAVSDDQENGQIIDENTTPANDTELTGLSVVAVGNASKFFSSGIQLASASLVDDARSDSWSGFEDLLVKTVGGRLSKIQNSTFFSALKTSLAANSTAAVAGTGASLFAADIYTLVGSIPAAERKNAVFVVSKETQAAIAALKTSGGLDREFPHALEANPTVLGYPLLVQSSAASADCYFGDFSSWMVCKHEPVSIVVMKERFRSQGFYGYIVGQRAEAKWTQKSNSDSSVKYLTFS